MYNKQIWIACLLVFWLIPSLLYGQQVDSCSSLQNAMIFEIVSCKTVQRQRKMDSIKVATAELQEYSKRFNDLDANISKQIKTSDSLWNLHVKSDCFLQANAAYPGESGEDRRANDQEKGYAISECMSHYVAERLEYLTQLSKSIYMIPVRNEGNEAKSKGKVSQPKKKCLKCKAASR